MGNRGILHDDAGRLTHRRWRHKHWIICRTSFRGRRRKVMSPGRYTELFFLDEATAMAAGHRPCCECRRDSYIGFLDALKNSIGHDSPTGAEELDNRLHRERAVPRRFELRTWTAPLGELPDGTMVRLERNGPLLLLWDRRMFAWNPAGYRIFTEKRKEGERQSVQVLTPATTVAALKSGYVPVVHPSLGNP